MEFPFGVVDYIRAEPKYPGYAIATNSLVKDVLSTDDSCDWTVGGGDDVQPDLNHTADEIAGQLTAHFAGTFGVMQPTGDRFANGSIDRIAGSPWIGREFARRMYGGNGPYWHEYTHMFVDEEIQCVAEKYGVFWQRRDLIHLHHHFQRESVALNSPAIDKPRPAFLNEANSPEHWKKYQAIFKARKAAGFPGSEPL